MPSLLDLLALTLVSSAVACAAGTEPSIPPPSTADAPATPRLGVPDLPAEGTVPVAPPPPPAGSEVTGAYSLDVTCDDVPILDVCLLGTKADKDVTFVLPPGTKKSSIVYSIEPHGPDAGGFVTWAGDDPLDGTVHLHGFAEAFSNVHIAVTGVMVVPE